MRDIDSLIRKVEKGLDGLRAIMDSKDYDAMTKRHAKMLLDDGVERLAEARKIAAEMAEKEALERDHELTEDAASYELIREGTE